MDELVVFDMIQNDIYIYCNKSIESYIGKRIGGKLFFKKKTIATNWKKIITRNVHLTSGFLANFILTSMEMVSCFH